MTHRTQCERILIQENMDFDPKIVHIDFSESGTVYFAFFDVRCDVLVSWFHVL